MPEAISLPAIPKTDTPEHWAGWLTLSARSLPHSPADAEILEMAIDRASPCATPDEVGFHAVVVISQYYVGDQPAAVQRATAKLWIEHLSAFPAWAIERAVAWWIGPDNPSKNRARRPLPGDIAERCRVEVGCIDKGRQNLAYWRRYGGAYPTFLTGTQPQRALT